MNRITKQVWCAACLGLWAQAAVTGLMADSLVPPGVPEPGLIIWGTVAAALDPGTLVTIDSMTWEVTSTSGEHAVFSGTPYVQIRADQKGYYVLEVPFDTRNFGKDITTGKDITLVAPENSFELKSPSSYTLVPTVNGLKTTIVKVDGIETSRGESYEESKFVSFDKGKVIRLDLTVDVPNDPWIEFCNKYFPGMDPDAIRNIDSDGDGATNYEEFLEGTDPTKMDGWHSADYNHDFEIDLPELLRLIQIYNADGYYHTDESTPDGFSPGEGKISQYHDSDYLEPRGEITMSELLRLISFFNSDDGYLRDSSQKDGFRPIYVSTASELADSEEAVITSTREFGSKCYTPGETLQIDVTIDGNVDIHSIGLSEILPKGWTLETVLSKNVNYRLRESKGTLEFYWIDIPELPCTVSYLLRAPSDAKGYYALNGEVLWYETDELVENTTAGKWIIGDEDIPGKLGYLQLPDGELAIIFEGELYESEDLILWQLLEGVESPYIIEIKDGKRFYRAIRK